MRSRAVALGGRAFRAEVLALAFLAWSPQAQGGLSFSTPEVRLNLDATGRVVSLVALGSGRELLRHGGEPFILLRYADRVLAPTRLREAGNGLVLEFGEAGPSAVLQVRPVGNILLLKVRVTSTREVEAVEFARLNVGIEDNVSSTLAARWDEEFGVVVIPGDQAVETVSSRNGVMSGTVHRDLGMARAIVGLVAVPTRMLDGGIEAAERALGIPSPRIGGVWAKRAKEARQSYLFADVTENNATEMITWARLGSFRTIMLYARTWAQTAGSYRINRTTFPNGELGLAATVQRLHSAGFMVGMHCLTSLVDKRDPVASPRPDGRLLKDGSAKLAAKLSAGAPDLVLTGQEGVLPRSPEEPGGTDVQVGDEVIRYRRVEAAHDGRLRLLGCERGANGTRAFEHTAGSSVHHLAERHGAYLADLRTSLAAEIAERLAGLIERVGFDMIYLDAGEVNNANGPYWYWAGRQQEEILKRVNRPLVVQGSGITPWTWHRFTRGTCDDGVAVGRDAWLEVHKIGRVLAAYRRNRMPAELGWWRLHDAGIGRPRTTASEAGLLGARSLELDVPFSVETTLAALRRNPESAAILEVLGRAERARLGLGRFSRESLTPRSPSPQTPQAEAPTKPLRIFGGASTNGLQVLVPTASDVPAGQIVARLPLSRSPEGIDLAPYDGISVALEVEGKSRPRDPVPVLNFQLETAGGRYRDYLVDVDFEGKRTVVVREPSADRVIRELAPTPGTYPLKASLQDADLDRTKTLNLRWMRGARTNGLVVRVYEVAAVNSGVELR